MEAAVFAVTSVLPVFLIVFIGFVIRSRGLIDDQFVRQSSAVVFNITLPALMVIKMMSADFRHLVSGISALVFLGVIAAAFVLAIAVSPLTCRNRVSRGALTQGAFRGNIAIVALPIIANMLGDNALTEGIIYLAIALPLHNILTVAIFTVFSNEERSTSPLGILKGVVTNPLTVAILIGVGLSFLDVGLPEFVNTTIGYLAQMSIPVALLGIGASLNFTNLKGQWGAVFVAVSIKNVLMPVASTTLALILGLSGQTAAILMVICGAPTAVASFMMAKAMHSDAELAASIVVVSTLVSVGTLATGAFLLKAIGIV